MDNLIKNRKQYLKEKVEKFSNEISIVIKTAIKEDLINNEKIVQNSLEDLLEERVVDFKYKKENDKLEFSFKVGDSYSSIRYKNFIILQGD